MGCPDECACSTCLADLRTMAHAMPAILERLDAAPPTERRSFGDTWDLD
jgi:hypothetical protein